MQCFFEKEVEEHLSKFRTRNDNIYTGLGTVDRSIPATKFPTICTWLCDSVVLFIHLLRTYRIPFGLSVLSLSLSFSLASFVIILGSTLNLRDYFEKFATDDRYRNNRIIDEWNINWQNSIARRIVENDRRRWQPRISSFDTLVLVTLYIARTIYTCVSRTYVEYNVQWNLRTFNRSTKRRLTVTLTRP